MAEGNTIEAFHGYNEFPHITNFVPPPPHARIQGGFLGARKPPLRLSAIFFCLLICPGPCNNLDPLLKFLYETPPSECTNPHLLNPGSAPAPPPTTSLQADSTVHGVFAGRSCQCLQCCHLGDNGCTRYSLVYWGLSLADSGGGGRRGCAPPLLKFQRGSSNGTLEKPSRLRHSR